MSKEFDIGRFIWINKQVAKHDPRIEPVQSRTKDRVKRTITGPMKKELRESKFYKSYFKPNLEKCLELLDNRQIEQIICYGLGSFMDGVDMPTSRYQLALILLIHEELVEYGCPLSTHIEIYDPLFTDEDVGILTSLTCPKFKLIEKNEHCARKIITSGDNRCALVYMPHLDNEFYNNLIGANWDADSLSKLILLGNDFELVCDGLATYIERIVPYVYRLVGLSDYEEEKQKKKRRKKAKLDTVPEVAHKKKALILLRVLDDDDDKVDVDSNFRAPFSSMAFHLVDNSWLKEHGRRIEQSRIKNWTCHKVTRYDSLLVGKK